VTQVTLRPKNRPVWGAAAAFIAILIAANSATASDATASTNTKSETEALLGPEGASQKASFLLGVVKFVRWPGRPFPKKDSPYVICVVGDDAFEKALADVAVGRMSGNHGFLIKGFASVTDVPKTRECHVAFVAATQTARSSELVAALREIPVLTVADWKEFSTTGGMIGLFAEGHMLVFEVDNSMAERAGLKISAQLLKMAKAVHWTAGR
jgi:hypothetical protein